MTTATFYRSVDKQLYDEEAELRKKKRFIFVFFGKFSVLIMDNSSLSKTSFNAMGIGNKYFFIQ